MYRKVLSTLSEFAVGERVQAHPACDCWMMGDRYGNVIRVGRKLVHVKMDISGKTRKFHLDNLLHTPNHQTTGD